MRIRTRALTKRVDRFLKKRAIKDRPDTSDNIAQLLKTSTVYYIDEDMQGWFVPKSMPNLTKVELYIKGHIFRNQET